MNFLTPTDVSPVTTGGWVDLDLSSYIPVGATGVALRFVNAATTDKRNGARNNDSTDATDYFIDNSTQATLYCGVDGSRICEVWRGGTDVTIYLDGYFGSEAVFFTNLTSVAAGAAASWVTVDISTAVSAGETALVAILNVQATTTGGLGFRPAGSTDTRNGLPYGSYGYIAGLASQKFEGWRATTGFDYNLLGYMKSGVTVVDPATDYSGTTTGVYSDLTALPTGAVGGLFDAQNSTLNTYMAMRANGATHDNYWQMRTINHPVCVGADASRIVENKRSGTGTVYYLTSYFVSANHGPAATGIFYLNGGGKPTDTRYLSMPHVYTSLIRLTTGSATGWVTYTVSSLLPSDATGVILRFTNGATPQSISARTRGSTDNDVHVIAASGTVDLFAGVDGGQIEYYRDSANVEVYVAAVFGEEAHFFQVAPVLMPSTVDAWETLDITTNLAVASHAPIAAFVTSTLGGADPRGFRMAGSTDNRIGTHDGPVGYVVGLASNQFDAYRGTATQKLLLKGYLMAGGTFTTNATEYSGSSTGVYSDLTAFPSGASGAVIEAYDVGGGTNTIALRANGSADDFVGTLVTEQTQLVVGLDSSRLAEAKRSSPNTRFYSSGYFTNALHQPTQSVLRFDGGAVTDSIQRNDEPYEGLFFFEGQQMPIDKTMETGILYFNGEPLEGSTDTNWLYFYGGEVSVRKHGWSAVPAVTGQYRIS